MPVYILHDPEIRATTTAAKSAKGSTEDPVDEQTGYEATNASSPDGAPWRTSDAAPGNTRALLTADSPRSVRGVNLHVERPQPHMIATSYRGRPAEINAVRLDGTNKVTSTATVDTSANFTVIGLWRLRPEFDWATDPVLGWFGSAYNTTNRDWSIRVTSARLIQGAWARYAGPGNQVTVDGPRVDDGNWIAAALVTNGTGAEMFTRVEGGAVTSAGTATCAAHSSQTNHTITIGEGTAADYQALDFGGLWIFQAALTADEITAVLDVPRDAYPAANLDMAWEMTSADVVAGTTITDAAGNHNGTPPDSWVTAPYIFAAQRWEEPVAGPLRLRSGLRFTRNGSSSAAPATPAGRIPESWSLIGCFRLRAKKHAANDTLCYYGSSWVNRDAALVVTAGQKIQVAAKRVGGAEQTDNSSSTFNDGELHKFLLTVDGVNTQAVLTVDGTVEATATGLSAHTYATNAQLVLGDGAAECDMDALGQWAVLTGIVTWAEAAEMLDHGIPLDYDPRVVAGYDLADPNLEDRGAEGAGTMDLVLGAGVSSLPDQVYPLESAAEAKITRPERGEGRIVLASSSSAIVDEHLVRIWSPWESDVVTVRTARMWDGFEAKASTLARNPGLGETDIAGAQDPRTLGVDLWLTRAQADALLELARCKAEVAIVAAQTDDGIGREIESLGPGRLVGLRQITGFYAKDSETYRYQAQINLQET